MVLIAIMTQAGFSGNNRYLVLGAALIDIVGGVGWGWAALELRRRCGRRRREPPDGRGSRPAGACWSLVFLFVPSWIGAQVVDLPATHKALVYQAQLRTDAAPRCGARGGPAQRACAAARS